MHESEPRAVTGNIVRKLRVLHLANTAGYSSGGIGDVAQELFRNQRKLGVDASIWFPGDLETKKQVEEITREHGSHVHAIPSLMIQGSVLPYGVVPLFGQLKAFDVIHQHGIWLPTSLLTTLASRGQATIISPHGLLEPFALTLSPRKKRIVGNIYENRNLRNAGCLAACSMQEAEGFREYGLAQPITVIPNGVSSELLNAYEKKRERASIFRTTMELSPSKSVLLFLSRLHPIKGLELLLEAVNSLQDSMRQTNWVLIVAGDGDGDYKKKLLSEVERCGITDIVRFAGPLYGEERIGAYSAAEAFVLVSHNENFGIVVAEALAMGVPVLTSTSMPWAETEREGCGFVVENTTRGVAQGLGQLMRLSREQRLNMGARGRHFACKRFDWEVVSREFLGIYEYLLNGQKPVGVQLLEDIS